MPTTKLNILNELIVFIPAALVANTFNDFFIKVVFLYASWLIAYAMFVFTRKYFVNFLKKTFSKKLLKRFFKDHVIDNCCNTEEGEDNDRKV